MKKLYKMGIVAILLIAMFVNMTYVKAADTSDAAHLMEKIKEIAAKTAEKTGESYEESLAKYRSMIVAENEEWLENFAGSAPTKELRKSLANLIDQEIQKQVSGGEVTAPSGMTQDQKSQVEKAVNEFIAENKDKSNYKAIIEQQLNSAGSGYTQEQAAYRRQLYQTEYNRIVTKENIVNDEDIKGLENLSKEEVQDKLTILKSELARLQNMVPSYKENGKTRDELILELQLKIEEYNKVLGQKTTNAGNTTGNTTSGKENTTNQPYGDDPIENPDSYKPKDNLKSDNERFIQIGNAIIGSLRAFGTLVMLVAFMVLGIRYMMGSTSDKAEYKETMIPYLIGAIMIFTIPNIIGIIYNLVLGL